MPFGVNTDRPCTGLPEAVNTSMFGCADQLEITPPNKITDEQIMQLLESGNSESIKIVLGSMASK